MKDPKVWLVLGAAEGLGPAAIKYLRANRQIVLAEADFKHARLDFIINNSNYGLFSKGDPDIPVSIKETSALLGTFLPYLKPRGTIINIPPQLCLATMEDRARGEKLLQAMDLFLTTLRRELEALNYQLRFLEPGERFVQL